MPGTGKDFHHACMNGNLDLFQASVRMHASEMERSEIEPLRARGKETVEAAGKEKTGRRQLPAKWEGIR